ncbi:MAG: hypothetical protein KKG33_14275 [candidate division Zixibacteria bacterium]|nr:hypothetical protein [candidate division Zixibacteria bacterium]
MVGAYLVVLTEGDADAMVIKRWLSELSPQIRTALSNGSLVVEGIGGASKLAFKAKVFRDLLCNIHAFLDNDQAGKDATAGAIDKGIISGSEYTLCSSPGMRESELEDLVKPSFYRDSLIQDYGVDIDTKSMQSVTGKWSDRMAELFKNSGKLWREHERMAVKRMVASVVSQEGLSALDDKRRNSLDNLVSTVERKLAEYSGL